MLFLVDNYYIREMHYKLSTDIINENAKHEVKTYKDLDSKHSGQ